MQRSEQIDAIAQALSKAQAQIEPPKRTDEIADVFKECERLRAEVERLKSKCERYHDALVLIGHSKGMTLLGQADDGCPEKSHQLGANRAFEQCAETALKVLRQD